MHEHRACFGDHHDGVIINPDTGTCRHCQLTLPVDRSDPLALVDTMLMHMARVHPDKFDAYAQKAASMMERPGLADLTATGFLDYKKGNEPKKDPYEGTGLYL